MRVSIFQISILLAGLLGALTPRAEAVEWFVATNGVDNTDVGRGESWALPFATISNAVAYATNASDIVTVSNGTYLITTQISITNAITVRSVNGYSNTVVARTGASNFRIFFVSNATAVVQGLTVTNGYNAAAPGGGGIYLAAGTVSNCVIAGCVNAYSSSGYGGGGLYLDGNSALLTDSIVDGNSTTPRYTCGGGVDAAKGTILRCIVRNNSAVATGYDGAGGGIYAWGTNVLVRDCRIYGNAIGIAGGAGIAGGTVENCLIYNNTTAKGWGGGAAGGAVGNGISTTTILRNCRVFGNTVTTATGDGGGAHGCTVINSTIHDNIVQRNGGGVYNCNVTNSIVYFNTAVGTSNNVYGGSVAYSCTYPAVGGTGNTTNDPQFADAAAGNYELRSTSPCRDTGLNAAAPAGTDLAGKTRIVNTTVDMGAYEYGSTLTATFTASPSYGLAPFTPPFTAAVYGGDTNGLTYYWDFDNNGSDDDSGADKQTTTYTYNTAGRYSVKLRVTNGGSEETIAVRTNYISVGGVHYVSTNGAHNTPFTSWADAATNLPAALAVALPGATVVVSNGTFLIDAELAVTNPVTIRSVNGPTSTTVKRRASGNADPKHRIFNISQSGALVSGLTVNNGYINTANGGGIYLAAGTVSNCVISGCGNNYDDPDNRGGGGVYMAGSSALLTHSVVTNNWTGPRYEAGGGISAIAGRVQNCTVAFNASAWDASGGGVYVGSLFAAPRPVIRNCLIYRNTAGTAGAQGGNGGGVYGGIVENCTVVTNATLGTPGAGGGVSDCFVTNSIVYGNTSVTPSKNYNNATFGYSCTTPDPGGTGNTTADPLFALAATNNFRPIFGSPCIDTGTNLGWTATATDLDGKTRLLNGRVDMGAYEFDIATSPLTVTFSGTPTLGYESLQVVFTSSVAGATSGLGYAWNFGNGAPPLTGPSLAVVTNTYTPGQYTVQVTVTNAAGETNSLSRTDYVLVKAANPIYVSTNGAGVQPYATWANAATNLTRAFALATTNAVVSISNGVYGVAAEMTMNFPCSVIGVNGSSNTTVRRTGSDYYRLFTVNHTNALLAGLTITNGNVFGANGGGVNILAGTVSNCVIAANTTVTDNGGGVYLAGSSALLTDSIVVGNWNQTRWKYGGGVYATTGTIQRCIVRNNWTGSSYDAPGGGIYAADTNVLVRNCQIYSNSTSRAAGAGIAGGTVENCLIYGNTADGTDYSGGGAAGGTVGGGIITTTILRNCLVFGNTVTVGSGGGASGCTVINCTVVTNRAAANGGGVYSCTVTNSIVYFNVAAGVSNNVYGGSMAYSCTTPAPGGTGNITDNPLFVNVAGGNYRLQTASPCIDKGTNLAWMATSKDLDGNLRILGKFPDMGAYETYLPPKGTLLLVR